MSKSDAIPYEQILAPRFPSGALGHLWYPYYRQYRSAKDGDKEGGYWADDGYHAWIPAAKTISVGDTRRSGPEQIHAQSFYLWTSVSSAYFDRESYMGDRDPDLSYYYQYGENAGGIRINDQGVFDQYDRAVTITETILCYPNHTEVETTEGDTLDVVYENEKEITLTYYASSVLVDDWDIVMTNNGLKVKFYESLEAVNEQFPPVDGRLLKSTWNYINNTPAVCGIPEANTNRTKKVAFFYFNYIPGDPESSGWDYIDTAAWFNVYSPNTSHAALQITYPKAS